MEDQALIDKSCKSQPSRLPLHSPDTSATTTDEKGVGDTQTFLQKARRFFREGNRSPAETESEELLPVLLNSFRGKADLRLDFPCWLASPESLELPDSLATSQFPPLVQPLNECLQQSLNLANPKQDGFHLLRDNLPRLELKLIKSASSGKEHVPFKDAVEAAIQAMLAELNLNAADQEQLQEQISQFKQQLPQHGSLLSYSSQTPLYLLGVVLYAQQTRRLTQLKQEVQKVAQRLQELVQVEYSKHADSKKASKLKSNIGIGNAFIDPKRLSSVMSATSLGSMPMAESRLRRIEKALAKLNGFLQDNGFFQPIVCLPHDWQKSEAQYTEVFSQAQLVWLPEKKCAQAVNRHLDQALKQATSFYKAMRVAGLELDDRYLEEDHDSYFEHFSWMDLASHELACSANVVWVAQEKSLIGPNQTGNLSELNEILRSQKPLKLMVFRDEVTAQALEAPAGATMQEHLNLLQWCLSHKHTYIFQSVTSYLEPLLSGLQSAVECHNPAVYYLMGTDSTQSLHSRLKHPGLINRTAMDSRFFPQFSYNPDPTIAWAGRFDAQRNSFSDLDWPQEEIDGPSNEGSGGKFSFTLADYLAQFQEFSRHFLPLEEGIEEENLLLLTQYLELKPDQVNQALPYIWMSDAAGRVCPVLVSFAMVQECRNQLEHWKVLQNLAGTHNYHAQISRQLGYEQAQQEAKREIESLKQQQQTELERVRKETARQTIEQLASFILNFDALKTSNLTQITGTVSTKATAVIPKVADTPEPTSAEPAPAEPTAMVKEDEELSEEAWIESFRCTSCNECIQINPAMFIYNQEKQAEIKDASAGSFRDMVLAAEKCPAKCIHPGQPLHADEPGLEDLKKRAALLN